MSTPKQIAAIRRNAEKSTGPRTAEGKAKTLKHGLTAETIVLPFESQDDDLQPKDITQQILVERLVQRHWISPRIARTERVWLQALYQAQLTDGIKAAKTPKPDPYAISLLQAPGDPHDLIHKNFFRYRAQIEQDFQVALRALERNHLLVTPSEENDNPEFGSVSQNAPSDVNNGQPSDTHEPSNRRAATLPLNPRRPG